MKTSSKMQAAYLAIMILMTGQVIAQEKNKERLPWGPDDEIGAMNYLTPETVLNASKLVTKGKVYSLGMTVDNQTPAFRHRYFHVETM